MTDNFKIDELTIGTDYVTDTRLIFENDRLYIARIPQENGTQVDFPEKIDVTEQVLDMFLRILSKRRTEAKQRAIVEQLKI